MRQAVGRFQPLHLAVRPAVLAVTLGASTVDVRDAADRVRSTLEPSGTTDDAQDVRGRARSADGSISRRKKRYPLSAIRCGSSSESSLASLESRSSDILSVMTYALTS